MAAHTWYKSRFSLFSLALLSCWNVGFAQTALPTDQDLQKMFDQKEYRSCLQQTARVLRLQGDAAKAYDPFTLQMRRGECFLNLGDWPTAAYAYHAAFTAAPSAAQAEQARAMEALVKASRSGQYFSSKSPNDPINIISLKTRQEAMKAFFNDQFAAAAPQIKAAQNATSLVPLIHFVPKAQELHALEMAGFGADPLTQPLLLSLGDLGRSMITTELNNKNALISGIENRANQMASSGFNWVTSANGSELLVADTRVGLSSTDRDTLRQMIPYLDEIVKATIRGKQVAQSFGRDGTLWDPVIAQAKAVADRAQNVLDAE
ncbi:MAG TPA: hypothetical protein VM008_04395 [Phycisphaerae bacterium]|nr:hypothetical protein [Phycisphaerae bacterium]